MYDLKADQNLYSQNIWEINTDSLSEKILSMMTLEAGLYCGMLKVLGYDISLKTYGEIAILDQGMNYFILRILESLIYGKPVVI